MEALFNSILLSAEFVSLAKLRADIWIYASGEHFWEKSGRGGTIVESKGNDDGRGSREVWQSR